MTELIPADLTLACTADPRLFDSTDRVDHARARQDCLACPARAGCLDVALAVPRTATGTFGGHLFVRGRQVQLDPARLVL